MTITFELNHEVVEISVDDNGIGRERSGALNSIKNKKHPSFATSAMQNKVDLLNKNRTNLILIEIIDKVNAFQNPSGTLVTIKIPINEH